MLCIGRLTPLLNALGEGPELNVHSSHLLKTILCVSVRCVVLCVCLGGDWISE